MNNDFNTLFIFIVCLFIICVFLVVCFLFICFCLVICAMFFGGGVFLFCFCFFFFLLFCFFVGSFFFSFFLEGLHLVCFFRRLLPELCERKFLTVVQLKNNWMNKTSQDCKWFILVGGEKTSFVRTFLVKNLHYSDEHLFVAFFRTFRLIRSSAFLWHVYITSIIIGNQSTSLWVNKHIKYKAIFNAMYNGRRLNHTLAEAL